MNAFDRRKKITSYTSRLYTSDLIILHARILFFIIIIINETENKINYLPPNAHTYDGKLPIYEEEIDMNIL